MKSWARSGSSQKHRVIKYKPGEGIAGKVWQDEETVFVPGLPKPNSPAAIKEIAERTYLSESRVRAQRDANCFFFGVKIGRNSVIVIDSEKDVPGWDEGVIPPDAHQALKMAEGVLTALLQER